MQAITDKTAVEIKIEENLSTRIHLVIGFTFIQKIKN